MKKIDEGYDNILDVEYDLCSINLNELIKLSKSWYKGIDLSEFDLNTQFEAKDKVEINLLKKTGVICNYFFAYQEGKEFYLLDGFNRLLTNYSKIEKDTKVYLKLIKTKLTDNKLMSIMLDLNLWKLSSSNCREFNTLNFLDRGFRLLLFKKFKIKIYDYIGDLEGHTNRTRDKTDFDVLDYYFNKECESYYFRYKYKDLKKIFSNKNIVNDLKEIIKSNDYLEPQFNKYPIFLKGFIMFLTRRRLKGDTREYKFETFIKLLKEDKKFFKKLLNMSWTDSTRKNIYRFFESIEEKID